MPLVLFYKQIICKSVYFIFVTEKKGNKTPEAAALIRNMARTVMQIQ